MPLANEAPDEPLASLGRGTGGLGDIGHLSSFRLCGAAFGDISAWSRKLVPEYLGTNDLCKLLSSSGKMVPPSRFPLEMAESAILVYAVSSNSPNSAVFLTSANFTNTLTGGVALQKTAKPMGNKLFVVFRMGGDGAILNRRHVGETNLIGSYVPLVK